MLEKIYYFHQAMIVFSFAALVAVSLHPERRVRFSVVDSLLLLFAGITLFTYNWELNPTPEKLLFVVQNERKLDN